jgi:hypothetical protein
MTMPAWRSDAAGMLLLQPACFCSASARLSNRAASSSSGTCCCGAASSMGTSVLPPALAGAASALAAADAAASPARARLSTCICKSTATAMDQQACVGRCAVASTTWLACAAPLPRPALSGHWVKLRHCARSSGCARPTWQRALGSRRTAACCCWLPGPPPALLGALVGHRPFACC